MHEMRHEISEKHYGEETSDVVVPIHSGFSFAWCIREDHITEFVLVRNRGGLGNGDNCSVSSVSFITVCLNAEDAEDAEDTEKREVEDLARGVADLCRTSARIRREAVKIFFVIFAEAVRRISFATGVCLNPGYRYRSGWIRRCRSGRSTPRGSELCRASGVLLR